jgi:2-polyprenyl-6-hydroxyphenyl methylase/3-demethylubiquinone-9 3-methyltransferase
MKIPNKIKYNLPIIGKILKDRSNLEKERNDLLKQISIQKSFTSPNKLKTLSNKHQIARGGLSKYLNGKKMIFDVGTGPNGSEWWNKVDKDSKIEGVDLYFFPEKFPKNVSIYKLDASKLNTIKTNTTLDKLTAGDKFKTNKINWHKKFDLVVANHVLEHVTSPDKVIAGISKLIKKNGIVYATFPDYRNFTDIFYHLIHPDGGGHIQFLTNDSISKIFKKYGFELIEQNILPDDWFWFQNWYKPQNFGIKHIHQPQIDYLSEVFREELTADKGYFYGWEMVFKKK